MWTRGVGGSPRTTLAAIALTALSLAPFGCASTSDPGRPPVAAGGAAEASEPVASPALATKVSSANAELVGVDASITPDPAIAAMLEPYAATVRARANRVVGTLSAPLDKADRGAPESTLGNWATDALRELISESVGQTMDVCFTNNGGLRRSLSAGEVTEGDLVELMPFENAIVVMEVSGARSRAIWEHLAQRGDPASGLTYRRVDGKPTQLRVGGAPIDDEQTYRVCTNDYLFEGGGGYGLEDVKAATYTGILIRDVFIQAFERKHAEGEPVVPSIDGRAIDAAATTAVGAGT